MRIQELIVQLRGFTSGVTREEFLNNPEKMNACFMVLLQIGETATQIRAHYPDFDEIPVKHMIALRNFVAHQYHKIVPEVIWGTITNDIPLVENKINELFR